MRICIVSQEYPPETGGGGIGTQSWLKAQGLSERGHHVEVVSVSKGDPRTEMDGNARIHRIRPSDFGIEAYGLSTQWLCHSMSVAQKLQELEAESNFDVIQFPEYVGEGFVYQTNRFRYRRARYCVQLHGPLAMFTEHMGWPNKESTEYTIGSFMEKSVIHAADGILSSSHNTARFCSDYYGYPLDRIEVIHSGVDTDRFAPRTYEPSEFFPRILFVGNLTGEKGFDLLVETVSRMSRRFPRIRLRTIGKANESIDAVRQCVAAHGAERNIEFLGYVHHSELPQQFAWADIFAAPSIYEPGPGNIYLEAMACGRPVIGCNSAGTPEVVLHERTGLLIPPQDAAALEGAIVRLAEDAELRARLGAAGRQWIAENFSLGKYIDRVERFYRQLLLQPVPSPGEAA